MESERVGAGEARLLNQPPDTVDLMGRAEPPPSHFNRAQDGV